jgi:two-component sensor histidine kinase
VELSQEHSAGYLLQVKDSGTGLPDTVAIHEPTTPGLAVTRAISDKLGATLTIASDGGTAFKFEIPGPGNF